jgi:chemotaxis protein methyltransferase CheR
MNALGGYAMLTIRDEDFDRLVRFIKSNYGINLTHKRTLIEGRLSNIIMEKGFPGFTEYIDYALGDQSGEEISVLINRLTTNHTFFMREKSHFDYFQSRVLPYLAGTVKDHDLRIWSAGCSSGEEPYTLEMILHDSFERELALWNTQILATDISQRALGLATKGEYPAESVESLPPAWKLRYFEKQAGDAFRVREEIRRDVIFRTFNLMQRQYPFRRRFHVIFCRNVMIYFDQATKNELVRKFYEATEPGGYLFIGHSESINRDQTGYRYLMPAVYRKQ